MKAYRNPPWWTEEYDSGWERVKAAVRRDWDQTKHDFGGDEPDTNQDLDDTVAQAVGKQAIPPRGMPTYEDMEPAYRFGHGARQYYGDLYDDWDDDVEVRLREDWRTMDSEGDDNWGRVLPVIRRGWDYEESAQDSEAPGRRMK